MDPPGTWSASFRWAKDDPAKPETDFMLRCDATPPLRPVSYLVKRGARAIPKTISAGTIYSGACFARRAFRPSPMRVCNAYKRISHRKPSKIGCTMIESRPVRAFSGVLTSRLRTTCDWCTHRNSTPTYSGRELSTSYILLTHVRCVLGAYRIPKHWQGTNVRKMQVHVLRRDLNEQICQ